MTAERKTRRSSAEVKQAKREEKLRIARLQVATWEATLARKDLGSQYREQNEGALAYCRRKLAALEAAE